MSLNVRNKGIRKIRVADIEDHDMNFRTHPESQRAALSGTINEIGWYGYPDCYETKDGNVRLIDGHLRKSLLVQQYGADAEIEVNITDFNEDEAKKAMLTHDPLAAMAEADAAKLDALLREVQTGDEALSKMLADLAEEAGLYQAENAAEIVDDEVPEPPVEPITKPGDLWLLGAYFECDTCGKRYEYAEGLAMEAGCPCG